MNFMDIPPSVSGRTDSDHRVNREAYPLPLSTAQQQPKKILLTANLAWNLIHFRGGLIEALSADGHELVALCPVDEQARVLEQKGCRVIPLKMDNKGISPRKDLALIHRIYSHFRDEKPDAILSYTIKNNIYGAIAAKRLGIPFIPNVTGLGTAFLSGNLLQAVATRLYRFAFKPLKQVFFQNHDDALLFQKLGIAQQKQITVLPGSGINLAHFVPAALPPEDEPLTFLMIARLLRDKGTYEFVEAARVLRQQNIRARFQILGEVDADNRTAIKRGEVTDWVREGLIEYLGTTEDVRPFITDAHCVVLPSYREGTPRTLLEASAMARPCVATNVPGCRDVVSDNETGLLCNVRDASDLANKMHSIFSMDAADRLEMGRNGRQRMERLYTQELVIDAYYKALGLGSSVRETRTGPSDTALYGNTATA